MTCFQRNSSATGRARLSRLLATTALVATLASPALAQDVLVEGGDYSGDGAPAISADTVSGDITVDVGNVTTTGDDATGIAAATSNGSVDIDVSGDVSTQGEASIGITVSATGDIAIDVAGAVSTLGYQSDGVVASTDSGDIDVTLSGGVSTEGVAASAVSLLTFDGDITATVGDVATLGNGAGGVAVDAFGGDASLETGSVTTTGDFATAVSITADGHAYADLAGPVSTSGQNASGIVIQGDSMGLLFTDVSVSGLFSHGVRVSGAYIGLDGQSIFAAGEHVSGLEARINEGFAQIAVREVSTTGFDSNAVSLFAESAYILASFETISTLGDSATGIAVESDGGAINLMAETVETQGFGSIGVDLQIDGPDAPYTPGAAYHGDINLELGSVSTAGENAHGVNIDIVPPADPEMFGGSAVTINLARVTTQGDGAFGLRFLDLSGAGNLDLTVADAATSGRSATAIGANVGSRDVTINSTGSIATMGDYSHGVAVITTGNVDLTANTITTAGARSSAIFVGSSWSDIGTDDSRFINVSVESASTSGRSASAIELFAQSAHIDLSVADVSTSGYLARAIGFQTRNGAVTIRATGSVDTTGNWSHGISGRSETGRISVLANDITTSGDYSDGISAWSEGGAAVDITTVGDVHVSGANSVGIRGISFADPDSFDSGRVTINILGTVMSSGEVNDTYYGRQRYGAGVYVQADSSDVTVSSDGHLESVGGYAFISNDRELGHEGSGDFVAGRDRLGILGSIAGDVDFGRGDDEFAIYQGADISRLGLSTGGAGEDLLNFGGWQGEVDPDQFDSFEMLNLSDGADILVAGDGEIDWSLTSISMTDSRLRLGNGVTVRGPLEVFDFDGQSALDFFDEGASNAHFIGDVFAPDGLSISLADGAGDDVGRVTGMIEGDLAIALDLGIGGGGLVAADQFTIDGDANGDIVLSLQPYAANGGSFAGNLFDVTGAHGDITLANGPLSWGGQVFDIEVSGTGSSQDKTYAAAPGQSSSVVLVSLGYTPDAAGAIALPSVIDALDSSLLQVRSARRGSSRTAGEAALWGDVRFDTFEGDVHGVAYDTEQTAILLGADLLNATLESGQVTGSLMFHTAESHTDLVQAALSQEHLDVDTQALGFSLGWSSNSSGRYVDLVAWGTDRSLELDSVKLDSQGLGASVEVGTHFDISASARLQPLLQLVWTDAQIDSFTDGPSGGEITPGAARSLRVRAGTVLSQSLSENWELEATAIADLNRRDSGTTVLATGYSDRTHLAGLGAEAGLRLTGSVGNWQVFGDVTGRWATGVDGADGVGGRVGLSRRF